MSSDEEYRILALATLAKVSPSSKVVLIPLNIAAERASKKHTAFYCIHSLSGAAGTDFFPLAQRLPDIRFYGVQAPPKCMHDPAFGGSIRSLAHFYAEHILAEQSEGPYLFGGWSAGAVIALEMAEIFRARHLDVGLLVALDGAPANTGGDLPAWHPAYIRDFALSLARRNLRTEALDRNRFKSFGGRAAADMRAAVSALKGRASGQPRAKRDPFDGFLRAYPHTPEHEHFIRRLYRALSAYQPPPRFDGEVIVYASKIGISVRPTQVGRIWRKIAPRAHIVSVDGSHTTFLTEPHVDAVADDLRRRLGDASARPT